MFSRSLLLLVFLLLLNWGCLPLGISSAVPLAQPVSSKTKRPAPPKRIPPNKVKPGGGLDFSRQACTKDAQSLVALVPIENPVVTTKSYPSFLFYIPDPAAAIVSGEFSLLTADDKSRIYQTSVKFQHTPGIVKIDLPSVSQYALEPGEIYHWYFRIRCKNQSEREVPLDIDGWIKRVPLNPVRAAKLEAASPDIWYDSVVRVAEDLTVSPEDNELRDRWQNLLQHVNLEYLRAVPLIERFSDRPSEKATEATNLESQTN